MYQQPKLPIFVLFASAGVLFDGAFSLRVSLRYFQSFLTDKDEFRRYL